MNRSFVSGYRFLFVTVTVIACFSALFWRLFDLHVHQQDKLSKIAIEDRRRVEVIPARRGSIVDARGTVLATTKSVRELGVDPECVVISSPEQVAKLASLLRTPVDEVAALLEPGVRSNGRPVRWRKLADGIDEDLYNRIQEIGIKGVYGNLKHTRSYPSHGLASHVVGFVNKEWQAVAGVERYMDFYLNGQDGLREIEADRRSREIHRVRAREIDPTPGNHIELTLDMAIQHKVEKELRLLAEKYQPESACIIVSEPSTGHILALGNYPSFDPNRYGDYSFEERRNRALTDTYEPGSTFKIIPAAGVLEDRLARIEDEFDCSVPEIEYNGRTVRLPGDHHPLGVINLEQIVVKSSNRGAALLGVRLGANRLHEYASLFGFGQKTEIGLSGESRGILHPVKRWDGLTISRLPMGHAISATPMQVHQSMSIIANGGVLMKPALIKRVFGQSGATVLTFYPEAKHRVVSTDVAHQVSEMLRKVVGEDGTARRAYIPEFGVAGKTGTSQKLIKPENGKAYYSHENHIASFSGFLPASNPRLVITVVVDDAQLSGLAYGGVVAAPVFRNIATHCIQYLGIAPEAETAGFNLISDSRPN